MVEYKEADSGGQESTGLKDSGRKLAIFAIGSLCGRGGIGRLGGFRFLCVSVQVRVLSPAPKLYYPNPFPIKDGFGYIFSLDYGFFPNGFKKLPTSKPRGPRKKKKM